jgi:SAM-dependent methyltransferase
VTADLPSAGLESLKTSVVAHYEKSLARFGPTARGMDWKDDVSQALRFAVLCDVCDLRERSVHDVGAGAGHLHDFLAARGVGARYTGSDLSSAMVATARALHPGVRFERRDLLGEPLPAERWDVVLCSGVFTVKLESSDADWWVLVESMLHRMFALCRIGIAFNLMSDRVDWRSPALYYASPGAIVSFCRSELSPFVVLRDDYPLHEFTVYVYREAPPHA